MPRLDPVASQKALKDGVQEAIRDSFPIEGQKNVLRLKSIEIVKEPHVADIRAQKEAKMKGRTFGSNVRASMELVDKETGEVIDRSTRKIATLPNITRRWSYIVDGSEYQVDNLWILKPGIYTRIKQNGELESQVNVKGGGFHMRFDPKSRRFNVRHGGATPPLYPIMKALGVDDDTLERSWGREIFVANKKAAKNVKQAAIDFANRLSAPGQVIENYADASDLIQSRFSTMELRPEVTKRTLGAALDRVSPEAVLRTSSRLLGVSRGTEEPDDRDSIMFKELRSTEDFVKDRIRDQARLITRKVRNNLDRRAKIGDIVGPDLFNRPVRSFFTKSSLSNVAEQTNPLAMITAHQKTTIMGDEGGIKSAHRIIDEAKLVNPSHFGFLDPLHTPECLTSDHSVFTKRGWVPWPKVDDDDEFACNIDGRLEFHQAERVVRSRYNGTVYGADTRYFSYRVTPNHRMWCRSRDPRSPKLHRWHFESAEAMHDKTRNVITVHDAYLGQAVDEFDIPFVDGNNSSRNFDSVGMEVWAAFMGWYLSEGSCVYDESTSRYFARIHQSEGANPENCKEIAWVLDQLPYKWTYADRSFIVGVKQLAHYVKQFGKSGDKFIPEYFFDVGVTAREELLAALLMGDGRLNYRRTNGDVFHDIDAFTTTSKRLADGVERLIISLGYAATHSVYKDKREERYLDVHEVRILRRRERVVRKGRDHIKENYSGMVYCATVPGGLLYCRRGGKTPFWSGNSEKTGVSLHTTLGLQKDGDQVSIPLYNLRTGKMERVSPSDVFDNVVVMPDEVEWRQGKPVPKKEKVKASLRENNVGKISFKEADYVMPAAGQIFSVAINTVPFLGNNSQNRATMSGRHQEQAVALKHREPPMVRSVAGGTRTYDDLVGRLTAQTSPISGTVRSIRPDSIVIEDDAGKKHDVPIYDNYPLNEKKGFLDSLPVVKEGQNVVRGELIADTSFTKDGVYAPGINLKVAYVPARGYNVEDGIVVSEAAAKKLTSEHMYKKKLSSIEAQLLGKKKFLAYYPAAMTREQSNKLGSDGVVRVGQKVSQGDVLAAGLSPNVVKKDGLDLGLIHKSLVAPYNNRAMTWEETHPGTVVAVTKRPKGVEVHVKTEEPAVVGDKIVSRHANKGIITSILPNHEMPNLKDGTVVDVLHNPIGLPGRMNVGQVLETAASKVAEKTGVPFLVKNFALEDARDFVERELEKHGLTDKEPLIDPKTGKELPPVLVGNQYTLKLHHQVDDKMSVRSRSGYDRNLIPKGGLPHGGQAIGALELYGLLGHGAVHNIREMQTYKGDRAQGGDNDALWSALQAGELLPPPKSTFAYQKFMSYLKGLGVNVDKDGNSLALSPMTDGQVLGMSNGEIKDGGRMVKMRTLEPEKGGLFDPSTTGGDGGKKWAHLTLKEAMPNPVFENAIRFVSGIRKPQFHRIIEGQEGVMPDGTIVGAEVEEAQYGPSAIGRLLDNIDVDAELKSEEERIGKLRGQQLNETNKRIKYLRALKKLELTPRSAYMMNHVPVIPPVMRPLSVMEDGNIQFDDINNLYKQVALSNQKLGDMHRLTPDEEKAPLRFEIYDELRALAGTGGTLNRQYPGILDTIAGAKPKEGYFQDKLVKKKQDLSMRSTIVPDPSLGLDEIAIPRKAARELYKPFIVRELRHAFGMPPLAAQRAVEENSPEAEKALDRVGAERPLLVKRDPVLHRYGIQAFKPRFVEGAAIGIHPLVTSGFNADFDGDAMAAFVPVTKQAVEEARRMMPSNMLFSPASGKAAYTPIKEMQVGLFGLTEISKRTKLKFADAAELEKAVNAGAVGVTDVVSVGGVRTTAGRLRIFSALPAELQKKHRDGGILSNLDYRFAKKDQSRLFDQMAKVDPTTYPEMIDKLKDLGNEHAFTSGFSIGLEDLKPHVVERDRILGEAEKSTRRLDLHKKKDAQKFVSEYEKALVKLESAVKDIAGGVKTHLDRLQVAAGIKGNGYRQLTAAPVLFTDAQGKVVPVDVSKSYAEGLDVADYWASMSGGRKGIIQKVQSVSQPGYLSKLMMNATMDMLVQGNDCGTTRGIALSTDEPDIIGRYLQVPIKLDDRTIPRGTMITPGVLSDVRNNKVGKVVVRTPMKCSHAKGVCPKCVGLSSNGQLYDEGTNVGVLSAQALGERGVQLALRSFHSGGVHDPEGQQLATKGIERAKELLNLPQTLKGSATLSKVNGKVLSIEKDPAGGWNVNVEGKRHYVPADRELNVRKGSRVKKGAPISGGDINPHEMLPLTGIEPVQNYLADELHNIYASEGIKRRNTEAVVRAMSDVTRVEDPGDHPDYVRGDFANTSQVQHLNKTQLKGLSPIRHSPILKGVKKIPQDVMEDWLARLNQEELKSTVIEGASRGWQSNIHGTHPIPGLVFGAEFGLGEEGY
jgi:DNA-directed RNA polymerase subunit beta'